MSGCKFYVAVCVGMCSYVYINTVKPQGNAILCYVADGSKSKYCLTLNLLTTIIVAPPSNVSKWQMGFNSAFKGLI